MRDKHIWIAIILIIILNLMDTTYTLYWFSLGISEGNPFLAFFARRSHLLFALVKMVIVILPLTFLWTQKDHRYTLYGVILILGFYTSVLGYHALAYITYRLTQDFALAIF